MTWFLFFALAQEPAELWRAGADSFSMGSAAVADLDGDGKPEVLFGTYFGKDVAAGAVVALHAADGKPFWKFAVPSGPVDTSIAVADGRVFFGASGGNVYYCLDGRGKELWTLKTENEIFDSPAAVADLDGDGKSEVLFGTCAYLKPKALSGYLRALDAATGREIWRREFDGAIQAEPAIVDLDGDGVLDAVVTTFRGDRKVHALSGKGGRPLWSFDFEGGKEIYGWGAYHGVAIGDGTLFASSYDRNVYAIDFRGRLRWKFRCDEALFAPVVLADADGDGALDALVCSESGTYYAISGEGKLLWKNAKSWQKKAERGVVIADVTGDGKPDVVAATQDGSLLALDLATGRELWTFEVELPGAGERQCGSAPVVADFDGDGMNDVFLVAGRIADPKAGIEKSAKTCVAIAVRTPGRGPGWAMFKRDLRHTGAAK